MVLLTAGAALRRYLADMVIATLQDSAYASLGPAAPEDDSQDSSTWADLPPPMLEDNEAQASECLVGHDLERAIVPELSSVSVPSKLQCRLTARLTCTAASCPLCLDLSRWLCVSPDTVDCCRETGPLWMRASLAAEPSLATGR